MSLCVGYVVVTVACLGMAFLTVGDPKGHFVLLQLPIALQGALICSVGFCQLFEHLSWVAAYSYITLPTLGMLYFLGSRIERGIKAALTADI